MLSQGVDTAVPETVARHATEPVIEVGVDPAAPRITVGGGCVRPDPHPAGVQRRQRGRLGAKVREHLIAASATSSGGTRPPRRRHRAEGRDIGTVVAPEAPVKVFLTASEQVRAHRRSADLAADPDATAAVTQREQHRRDRADAPQTVMAADAVEIDSSSLSLAEVISRITDLVRQRTGDTHPDPARAR